MLKTTDPAYRHRSDLGAVRLDLSSADQLRTALGSDRTVTTSGRAATQPVAPETVNGHDDPAGRALNRRVVITVGA